MTAVASGGDHTCALHGDGTVWCWGRNFSGQLGDGTTVDRPSPTKVNGLADVSAIAASKESAYAFTCAIAAGHVYCWGDNSRGQLGDGSRLRRSVPTKVTQLPGGVTEIALGSAHACARSGGAVACWGNNASGQLGVQTGSCQSGSSEARRPCDSTTPMPVPMTTGTAVAVRAGNETTAVIVGVGAGTELETWGGWDGRSCRVYSGSPYPCSAMAQQSPGPWAASPIAAFALGLAYGCFLSASPGYVRCWGEDEDSQLGGIPGPDGASTVSGLSDAVAISTGHEHACAARLDGSVVCWGANAYAQLGGGAPTPRAGPTVVVGLDDVEAVSAGRAHTCALRRNGEVWCWGKNDRGQVGGPALSQCGSMPCTTTPVGVGGL